MGPLDKTLAILDRLRLFQKALLLLVYYQTFSYMELVTIAYVGSVDKTAEFTAFVTVTIPAIMGIVTNLTNKFFNTITRP